MKNLLTTAAVIAFSAVSASAANIDFESYASGTDITGLDLGGVSITQGGSFVRVTGADPSGDSTRTILGNTNTATGYRADFTSLQGMVSVDIGDFNQDADDLYLWAYDAADSLIDSDMLSVPGSFSDMATLSVSVSNISYVIFGGFGLNGHNNVYADNLSFETAVVPLPAGGLLLGSALLGFGMMRRRKKG